MSQTESDADGPVTCLYPGCDEPAVAKHKHGGPPPRYCENEDHNAASAYEAMKKEGTTLGDGTKT